MAASYPNVAVCQLRTLDPIARNDGSQAILLDILRHFSMLGVRTTVYCGWRPDMPERVELFPGVDVRRVLRFDHTAADPYASQPAHLVDVISTLRRVADEHDVLYVHDSNLRFGFAAEALPTVVGVHDLVYGHTLAGTLAFARDRLVAASDYVGACVREAFRAFRPLPDDALWPVNYGFASEVFGLREPTGMRRALGVADDTIALLFPHRPETAKGAVAAVTAMSLLEQRLPPATYRRVRLLLPRWYDPTPSPGSPAPPGVHPDAYACASELGIEEKLLTHRWVPRSRMAEYYCLGTATLCVGTFPEAFGNVHVESSLCGTPALVSRVAAQRSTVPEELVRKVDPGDVHGIADHLAEIIERRERTSPDLRRHLSEKFSMARMLTGYARAILGCGRRSPLPLADPPPVTEASTLRIPPWAARLATGYYHDYTGYDTDPVLADALDEIEGGATVGRLVSSGAAGMSDVDRWVRAGLLVADPPAGS